jgi:hypothetical protein
MGEGGSKAQATLLAKQQNGNAIRNDIGKD